MKNEMKQILLVAGFTLMQKICFPSLGLLQWMGIAIVVDFFTGVVKAAVLGRPITSNGFKQTVIKFLQYGGAITVGIILNNAARHNNLDGIKSLLDYLNNGLVVFIIYIEVTSIFENIYECDKNSPMGRFFIKPILKVLTFQIKNNPVSKLSEETSNH